MADRDDLTAAAVVAGGTGESMISLRGVDKWDGVFQALKGIDLEVGHQEVVVVIGPSGSGKSTLIRCVNQLEHHDAGSIWVDGVELTGSPTSTALVRQHVGMVFQQFNLFPHLTVLDNVTLGLRHVRRWPKKRAEEAALAQLEQVRIAEQAAKFPGQLSGGQQQRVAIL